MQNKRYLLVIERPGNIPFVQYIPTEQLARDMYEKRKFKDGDGIAHTVYIAEVLESKQIY